MLKGVIFDMDGTITLTEPLHHKAYTEVFRQYGVHDYTYEEEMTKYAGSGSSIIFPSVFRDRGINFDDEKIKECRRKKKELYTKLVQESEIEVVEGVHEFVKKVEDAGLKKIIATGNGDLEAVRFILKKVNLLHFFPEILSIGEVPRGKPFPDIFIEAARRLGYLPSECVILEDSINGVLAARAADILCIALETTTNPVDLKKAGATFIVKNYFSITDEMLYGTAR